jgi:hypothetical protein
MWPTPECPLRPAMQGEKHIDIVPVCYVWFAWSSRTNACTEQAIACYVCVLSATVKASR